MRVLVTGTGGFIGWKVALALARGGIDVLAVYRRTRPVVPAEVEDRISLLRRDLAVSLDLEERVDVVVHAAAHTHLIPNSGCQDYIRNNVLSTLNMAQYARSRQVGLFVYLSTLSVYGTVTVPLLTEQTPLNQPQMYGLTKYMGETILREYRNDVSSVCIRLPGVVDEGYFEPWLGQTLKRALRESRIVIYNGDSPFNNVIDPAGLVKFIRYLADSKFSGFEVVNMAAAEPITVRMVVKTLCAAADSGSEVVDKSSDRASFLIDLSRMQSRFSFLPDTTREIVTRYGACNKKYKNREGNHDSSS